MIANWPERVIKTPPHSWQLAPTAWLVCRHCGLEKKSRGRKGTLWRRATGGQTWLSGTTPECPGPRPDPAQPPLFA